MITAALCLLGTAFEVDHDAFQRTHQQRVAYVKASLDNTRARIEIGDKIVALTKQPNTPERALAIEQLVGELKRLQDIAKQIAAMKPLTQRSNFLRVKAKYRQPKP